MALSRETEVKLAASSSMLAKLRVHPRLLGEEYRSTLVNSYFDTVGGKLHRSGGSLRIRSDDAGKEQTLKLPSAGQGPIRRQEWNVPIGNSLPDPARFPPEARTALTQRLGNATLEPLGQSTIERTRRRIRFGASIIEAAFDEGEICAGSRKTAVGELELELVEGHPGDLLEFALELPVGPELFWSKCSKAERCATLALDLEPAAVSASPVRLTRHTALTEAFQTIAWNCLDHLLANYPLVAGSGNSEAVHQCRVAIRRLRAAFGLFGKVVADKNAPILLAEWKAAASSLGPARNLDVLLAELSASTRGPPVEELKEYLDQKRAAALDNAKAMLRASAFQKLLFDTAHWIEAGAWIRQAAAGTKQRDLPTFASDVLSHRQRKVAKAKGRVAKISDKARHRLRIGLKKLRYAAEFFASLYRDKKTVANLGRFQKALRQLQDCLGELNDMATAATARNAYFDGLEPITAAKLETQLTGFLDMHRRSRGRLLKRADRLLDRVAGSRTWWKDPG